MELHSQLLGPALAGIGALLLGWLAFGKNRPKAQAVALARAGAAAAEPSQPREAKPAREPKPRADTKPRSETKDAEPPKQRGERAEAKTKAKAASDDTKPSRPAPKAIVWTAPQTGLDDEDITVVHVLPVYDESKAASVSIEAASVSIEAASVAIEGESEEDRVSRVELSYEQDAEAEEVTAASARILLYAAGDSDQGRVRQRNEDSMLVMPERSLFAVADGMGGHRGGAVASSLAIDALQDAFDRSAFDGRVQAADNVPRRARELAAAVHMTNECVRSMAFADRELSGMGTTLVAARFSPNKQRLYIGHVGDSRCYRLRAGKLTQLTTDHTMATLGMTGPRANDLYQAIGVTPGLMIDLIVDKPQDDDVYLLCSDGLSKMLSDDKVRDVLVAQEDLESALYTLIESANDRGGKDNVTVILVKVLARTSPKAMESIAKQSLNN